MSENLLTLPEPPLVLGLSFEEITLRFGGVFPGDPERGLVPFYHFRLLTDGQTEAGHINFRVGDSEHVRICAGHIGYEVQEQFRGRGFAYQACRAIAPLVRTIYSSVIITSDPDNRASIRTIERLGAVFIREAAVPPHDPHYRRGSRTKRLYRWTP